MDYNSLPDVSEYAAQYGDVVNSVPPTPSIDTFKSFRDRRGAQDLGQSSAVINGQLPYHAPQLLTSDQIRWQAGMTFVGGLAGLLLYSYILKRPLFG
jgi:hypothetical protein